jgi:serine/threonine-protein kinase
MGSLYLARDPGLDRLVAIKLLKDEYQDDPELRERFIREARSVARLRHENIIIVFDIGEADGLPFMAMEYIAGETVAQLLRRSPTPPLTRRLTMAEELCAGLAHAHGAGIIHRDIKPANLMMTGDGVLKILDFGIARLADSGMTQGGMMLGTVNYMSPEQVAGPTVDHRSDIFATGAVLYELITLEQAFPGRIDSGVLNRILYEGPTPIEQRVPGIDADLAAIVRRALQRAPEDRYQHASEMARELARVRRRLADAPMPVDPAVGQNTTVAERPKPSSSAVKKSDSSRQKILTPERFAELQRQQVEEHLRFGEAAFARGDHDGALHYGERAAMVDPDSRAAIDLINRARFAIESKAMRALLAEARRQLADGRIEDAAALANQAGADLPHLEGADDLRADLRRISEDISEARAREHRITTSLDKARASIEQGGYETALRALYEVLALDPDRAEARELEQSAISQLQAQREHQRARRQAHDRLTSARQLAEEGRFDEALATIAGVDGPSDTVRMAAAAAATDVRAQQRRARAAEIVAAARRAFDQGEFEQARSAIDTIAAEDVTPDARALRADADRALRERVELERKQRAVDDGLRAVAALVERSDLTGASAKLDEVERIGLTDPRITDQRSHVAGLMAADQERRRQEARGRLAAKLVETARNLLENGAGQAAISLLERDSSGHPLVADALRDVRATVAGQEERERQEAERRRQEEEARRRAEFEATRKREEARLAEEQRTREEERRAREAERDAERARRREEFATLVIAAEHALDESDPDQATVLVTRALNVKDVDDSELAARAAAVRAEVERREQERAEQAERAAEARRAEDSRRRAEEDAQRREEFATLIVAAEKALGDAHDDQATVLLARALNVPGVDDATLAARAAAVRAEVERREQARAEQARREAEREAVVTRLLTQERQQEPEAALTTLHEALTLAPRDERIEKRIAQRNDDLDRQRVEAERQRQIGLGVAAISEALDRKALDEAEQLLRQAERDFSAPPFKSVRATYDTRRREEAERQAREAREAREREAREAKERARREKEAAARKRQEEKAAQRAAAGTAEETPSWTKYAAAAAIGAVLIGGAWAFWPRSAAPTPTGQSAALPPPTPTPTATPTATPPPQAPPAPISTSTPQVPAPVQTPRAGNAGATGPGGVQNTDRSGGSGRGGVADTPRGGGARGGADGGRGPVVGPQGPVDITKPDPTPAGPDPVQIAQAVAAANQALQRRDMAETERLLQDGERRYGTASFQGVRKGFETLRDLLKKEEDEKAAAAALAQVEAADRNQIQGLLGQYVDAYVALDERRLRALVPGFTSIQGRALIKSVQLRLSNLRIDFAPDRQTATVSATQNFQYEWNRAGLERNGTGDLRWRVRKSGGAWTVVP